MDRVFFGPRRAGKSPRVELHTELSCCKLCVKNKSLDCIFRTGNGSDKSSGWLRVTLQFEPPPGVVLRTARRDDYAFAWKLYRDSTEPLLKVLGRWNEDAVLQRFDRGYRNHESQVICVGDHDIGWLQVSQNDTSLHLHQVHLVEAHRNCGTGSRLICAVMTVAEALRLPVTLNVIRGNRAVALYHRLGFRVFDEDEELVRMRWDPRPVDRTPPIAP